MGANKAFIEKRAPSAVKHGNKRVGAATPEYKTWLRIKSRCYRKTDKDYPKWGGRGIGVSDRWLNDFSAFLADMGPRPTPLHTIDRLKSSENYGPGNCRWATVIEQCSENRRDLIPVTVQGIAFKSLAAACRHFGILPSTLNARIRASVPIEDAFAPTHTLKSRRTRESYLRKDRRPAV